MFEKFQDQAPVSSDPSASGASGMSKEPMPDPRPLFEKFLQWALELGIVTYVMMLEMIPVLDILATLKDDEEKRAKIYSACTGLREDLVRKLVPDHMRQAENLEVAIKTDDRLAETFVLTVGISYYVQHIALEKIYSFVMGTMWMFDSSVDAHRAFAALLCKMLVEHKAFNNSNTRTHERILTAITVERLFGDSVPAELRIRAVKALQEVGKKTPAGVRYLGSVMFDPENGVTFDELSQHLEVSVMAEPFVFYATELGLARAQEALIASELPPAPADVFIDVDEDENENDSTSEVSAEVAEALAEIEPEMIGSASNRPPPIPSKRAASSKP